LLAIVAELIALIIVVVVVVKISMNLLDYFFSGTGAMKNVLGS